MLCAQVLYIAGAAAYDTIMKGTPLAEYAPWILIMFMFSFLYVAPVTIAISLSLREFFAGRHCV
jgi:hypothetical protein